MGGLRGLVIYATSSQGDLADTAVQPEDINTLSALNAIITDATLIDTTDSRLSDARAPTAHTHAATSIAGGTVSDTEFGYLDGVTSSIQTQLNTALLRGAPDAVIEEQFAAGTNAGNSTANVWYTRPLNTEVRDPGGIVSISAGLFTLTTTCWVEWETMMYDANLCTSRIYGTISMVTYGKGTPQATNYFTQAPTKGGCECPSGVVLALQSVMDRSRTNGYGYAANLGQTEVYSRVRIWRLA